MASASSSNPSSSGLETPPTSTSYDVFLSFRGSDTRYKFTSHLYAALDRHGIRTFKDDHELRTGEVISAALIKAIKESKTYVVVFSENYASSSWCLDELVEIYNCHQKMDRLVIGVFYNIEPWIVRHQKTSFEKVFEDHEIRYAGERKKVIDWRFTLNKVAGLSGHHVSAGSLNIDILEKRCLLTINDDDELGMHDMLQDMGRRIAQNNFRNEPENYSRLWVSEDIFDVLKKQKNNRVLTFHPLKSVAHFH